MCNKKKEYGLCQALGKGIGGSFGSSLPAKPFHDSFGIVQGYSVWVVCLCFVDVFDLWVYKLWISLYMSLETLVQRYALIS